MKTECDLMELIRQRAKQGELTHLSLIATASGKFSASFAPASVDGYGLGLDADPVMACIKALNAPKLKRRRVAVKEEELEDWEK